MTVINEDGTHTYVETTPVEQTENEDYEEVVEQTAEETENVPEEKKNNEKSAENKVQTESKPFFNF